jgi:hypothetical protein
MLYLASKLYQLSSCNIFTAKVAHLLELSKYLSGVHVNTQHTSIRVNINCVKVVTKK